MPAAPSTIPASATVTNLLAEPLTVYGLPAFAVGEVRVLNMSAFVLAQRSVIWNALYNAKLKNLVSSPDLTFDVNDLATGHQGVVNRGGHGVGGSIVPVPGGLGLPASVSFTNLLDEPLVIVGVLLPVGGTGIIDFSGLSINQQSVSWNDLINARDKGLISSPDLTTAVQTGFTGHQGSGGQDSGGNQTYMGALNWRELR
jgi:hypothetical protein